MAGSSINPVKIGNMALSNIGTTATIESMDEPTVEARQLSLWYDFSRQQVLEGMDWSFARASLVLATSSDAPPTVDWGYVYQYPADCIVMRNLVNPLGLDDNVVPFIVKTNVAKSSKIILTNLSDAIGEYTFNVTTTSLFSPMFVEALSYLLAYHVAYPITNNMKIKEGMLQGYIYFLRQAQAMDANEVGHRPPREAESIRVR